jgi:hypothetical protein
MILFLAPRQETNENHIFFLVAQVTGKIEYGEIDRPTAVSTPIKTKSVSL